MHKRRLDITEPNLIRKGPENNEDVRSVDPLQLDLTFEHNKDIHPIIQSQYTKIIVRKKMSLRCLLRLYILHLLLDLVAFSIHINATSQLEVN